jgi:hypothetical protein
MPSFSPGKPNAEKSLDDLGFHKKNFNPYRVTPIGTARQEADGDLIVVYTDRADIEQRGE